MTQFTEYIDLASERLGGAVLLANDEFFAPKENLLKPTDPVWKEGKYTDRGKWMDGWETRRRRTPGHDWCVVRLGLPGVIHGVVVDTAYFTGNFPQGCSIEGCTVEGQPHPEQLLDEDVEWVEILERSPLEGDTQNIFKIGAGQRFTHLRLRIYPDGGVARLRVHGEPLPDLDRWRRLGEIDLGAMLNGGRIVDASDMFYGSANNLLMPGRGKNMGDGWETKRRRGPGHDWVVVELGTEGRIEHLVVDTHHFKGNYPDRFSLDGCRFVAAGQAFETDQQDWRALVGETKLQAHTRHKFEVGRSEEPVTHVRLNIFPDGGVSRLRLHGHVSQRGWQQMILQWLNTAPKAQAYATFDSCCGSSAWAERMTERRPYATVKQLEAVADEEWADLNPQDWLEAFKAHPKIGENKAEKAQSDTAEGWSDQEQSGTREASQEVLDALHEANRAYEEKFGFIFIVCATGKSAQEMLEILERRLENDRDTEIKTAAEEQRKITQLRLEKLFEI